LNLKGKIRLLKGARGSLRGLHERDLDPDPIRLFQRWFKEANRAGLPLPDAVALATVSADGRPSCRMMLLKGVDARGFVLYTNFQSRKGAELTRAGRAALVAHWAELERQVRVEGRVEQIPAAESDAYFASRPRGSQVGAWASPQSAVVSGREELEAAYASFEKKFKGQPVPRPPHWGGFCLRPDRIEFWQGRLNRMHDRLCYERAGKGWNVTRLAP
jgi:pyridoxamine 5'-phosphate oxidase